MGSQKHDKSNNKISLGQFFTRGQEWLKPQIIEFIRNSGCKIAYDPFAGAGDLLSASQNYGISEVKGLDIDDSLIWEINDSLINIPSIEGAIIITNPPYLAKQSATRKKLDLTKYFNETSYDDLYLIALEKMILAQKFIVAIIPESFINSSFKNKNLLSSITVLEENPFTDTENPVCVACFDGVPKDYKKVKIYKNGTYENTLENIENFRLIPSNNTKMIFNDLSGWLGIRAIDSTDDKTFIRFDFREKINYDWENKICVSSRHFTLVQIDVPKQQRQKFIDKCNDILNNLRLQSADTILTPFMGNTKKGKRRRRLDFRLARAIMEKSYEEVIQNNIETKSPKQISLFDLENGENNEI